ncbi:S-adenosyl-L-methionine-dependent methyltransferase [Schizophyllum amplum]|uniref:S-adenosyl-L-methionine-dependent methyltransferase n=1 Tax=Schizophyllum amplum TaxID=97359 RepID=A0A550CN58_9AGAR|nr:S-adenosyl-L-methionine-dependent methyltransferase [Auriculariopsis ampla]
MSAAMQAYIKESMGGAQYRSSYLLEYDEEEAARLNRQHEVLTRAYDGRLILAPLDVVPNLRILDSGTGTGVWALSASAAHPEAFVTGIDIEERNFPRSLPPNANFLTANLTALPEEWSGQFGLVHQRLLMGALRQDEWTRALAEAYRVLQPGGWIQSLETDPTYPKSPMLEAAGFRDVRVFRGKTELAGQSPEAIAARANFIRSGEEYDALLRALEVAFEKGVDGTYPLYYPIFCAQKPY